MEALNGVGAILAAEGILLKDGDMASVEGSEVKDGDGCI